MGFTLCSLQVANKLYSGHFFGRLHGFRQTDNFVANAYRANTIFYQVIINVQVSILQVYAEFIPTSKGILQCSTGQSSPCACLQSHYKNNTADGY